MLHRFRGDLAWVSMYRQISQCVVLHKPLTLPQVQILISWSNEVREHTTTHFIILCPKHMEETFIKLLNNNQFDVTHDTDMAPWGCVERVRSTETLSASYSRIWFPLSWWPVSARNENLKQLLMMRGEGHDTYIDPPKDHSVFGLGL
jgi:hypothetical protein